ncbi:MAG: TRAP-type C4-dicarboxylate transport system, small permease component [Rhodobacteraceae bacterium HLUCCO07]|nr:MAG: TRAP-type C4-dicarboxylate transport system, small permease component [Rhodobacteraceae bacterium HLUCCO07]
MMHRFMNGLARLMAILGGIVLTALVILTCVSVLGRGINTFLHWTPVETIMPALSRWLLDAGVGPVWGDYELVEAGVAFAIFAFIPLCQITAGHATVDIFTARLPKRANRVIQMVVDIVFAAVLILIAWRIYAGMESKMQNNETTFLLQFPIWWSYLVSLIGAVVAAIVGVYMAVVRIAELLTMRTIIPAAEVDH